MEIFDNFKDLFLSVWNRGILGIDIFEILIGLGIFLIFLIFRGLISKLIIKKLEIISQRTTNKLDDTFVKAMVGPARFLPIVLGFFIASYYMSFSEDTRSFVDNLNRTLITILLFSNVKRETRKAEIKATIRPSIYFISALKIIETPNKDKIPSINSYNKNFFLNNKGSISEVKNAAEDIIETAIETLEILIA